MSVNVPTLLIATNNKGKLKELGSLLGDIPAELLSLEDVGIDFDVDETGSTFEENATLKAAAYARMSRMLTLSDDSGLEVDALNGEPGVRSSRYAGEGATDADRIAFLLRKLNNSGVPPADWTARFRCVVALASPKRLIGLHSGECAGRIVEIPRGDNGFGYDPVFLLTDRRKTMAELTTEEKNGVSHRSKATRKAAGALKGLTQNS